MTLDTATLFLASVALDFAIAAYFWTLWIGQRDRPIHLWLALSATSATFGCILYMLRQIVPDWIAVWAAQILFIQVFAFLWAAVRLVHGRPRPVRWVLAGSAIWSAACLVPPFFAAEQPRNVVATLLFAAYCFAMCVEMLRARPIPNRWLAAGLLLVLSVVSIGMTAYTAMQSEVVTPLLANQPVAALWLLLYLVIYVVLVLAVTTLELGNEADRQRAAAATDGLTGLPNRRAFRERSERPDVLARGAAVLVLDIDHFKRINDEWGHAGGDDALVRFAAALRGVLAPLRTRAGGAPILARMGGEEFVSLLPGATLKEARRLGEAIRAAIEGDRPAGRPAVTVSIGLAFAGPGEARSMEDLLRSADRALYRAKREGRNRLVEEGAPADDGRAPVALQFA
ncbi:GGDEF domain-containing protein [Aureimonas sp. SK2]|uniref:GGDEF domain-containing protein n=1 Tax=Aureimonas sp. SK2 TaxID=3015992 RepID=UPI002443A568|nr:GGDEF domain-containing protein [Aureimonas sp. SK2]